MSSEHGLTGIKQGGSAVTTGASSAVQKRAACDPRTSGIPNNPDVDGQTDTVFQGYSGFKTASAAANNVVPGFTTVVSGSNYAASDSTYMGYQMVKSYSPSQCAAACNSMSGCQSFNICMFLVRYAHISMTPMTHTLQTLNVTLAKSQEHLAQTRLP